MMETDLAFEDAAEDTGGPPAPFVVDVDGFEGPIDALLTLARDQKVDLTQVSILQLADQYLAFVAEARRTNLELAADYLVMAAWLAYLKSRLLLPDLGDGDEPTGAEMASALAFQLRRLEAMQEAGSRLMARGRLGAAFFARGEPETFAATAKTVIEVTLYDLLKGYGDQKKRQKGGILHIEPWTLYTVEDSLKRLRGILGGIPDWRNLSRFLPAGLKDKINDELKGGLAVRSALASTFAASLEMVREGELRVRQSATFGPIYLRARGNNDER